MIFSTTPESISGVKTTVGWNIRPSIETKMPLANQMSRVTWQKKKLMKYISFANWGYLLQYFEDLFAQNDV